MFGNSFGRLFKVTSAGESYSGAFRKSEDVSQKLQGGLVTIVDGVPAGLKLTALMLQEELDKRRPGQSELDTPRSEADKVYILTGVMEDDYTTGAPVALYIPNNELPKEHIDKHLNFKGLVRPGQASYSYFSKYGNDMDWLGAGRASGRETASRVAGGAVAKAILEKMDIDVVSYISEIHGIKASTISFESAKENYRKNELNCPDLLKANEMIDAIKELKKEGDTCGGVVEIIARGVPAGIGEPVFDKLDAALAHALMSIGAVKGIEFGQGFGFATQSGKEANDLPFIDETTGKVGFKTNRAGGILGGISIGEDIRIRVAVKATPTISIEQDTINLKTMKNEKIRFDTRNDPCICPRIYPVCEAMVRMVILDFLYMAYGFREVQKMVGNSV